MNKTPDEIYSEAIALLDILEISIENEKIYHLVRKKILDIANDIKRFGDQDGIT